MPLSDCGVQGQWRQTAYVLIPAQHGDRHPLPLPLTANKIATRYILFYRDAGGSVHSWLECRIRYDLDCIDAGRRWLSHKASRRRPA